ncbi:hypothetical protein L1987_13709 [Smallanthus sonchifolius]|uniref:Uncharacterized protein n=1 Tax=Smallanthus sonchifolius TaxID=185202 RepID=A0ACB9JIA0_9ASTR|nr:hypothetical protein L1987_13709 [Smallanthus sonchifolius]
MGSSSTSEDFCVDLLPYSTCLNPCVPDSIIPARKGLSTSQSEDFTSFQDNASTDLEPIVNPISPVTEDNSSSREGEVSPAHYLSNLPV